MLSPTIYLCAGLIANLEVDGGGKLAFAFSRDDWPRPLRAILVGFVGWRLPSFAR